jgi:hypothetical protein
MITPDMIYEAKAVLHNLVLTEWLNQDLFSPTWWGVVAFIVFSYILCLTLLDKRRLTQILLFGSLMTVAVSLYDTFGANFNLWTYLTRVFPIIPSLFLYDFTVIPLYYMLVYQYSVSWKSFILWNAVAAGVISAVFFPVLVKLNIVAFSNWNPLYHFPFTFAFALLARAVVTGVVGMEEKRREEFMASKNKSFQPAFKPKDYSGK